MPKHQSITVSPYHLAHQASNVLKAATLYDRNYCAAMARSLEGLHDWLTDICEMLAVDDVVIIMKGPDDK